MSKTVVFQTIKHSISAQFSSIWPIDRILSGATIPNQSGPRSDGSKGVVIYLAFCLDLAQGHMKGAPNETRTHSCRFASRAC